MEFSKKGKDSNRQDVKKAEVKKQIYEEFEGKDLDSIKQDFKGALEVSSRSLSSPLSVLLSPALLGKPGRSAGQYKVRKS